MSGELLAQCSLWRAAGVGPKTFRQLLKLFGSAEGFFNASPAAVREKLPRLDEARWRRWRENPRAGQEDLDWLAASAENHIVPYTSRDYPQQLQGLSHMAPLLFVKGDLECLQLPQLAIVGSRNASRNALNQAREFARDLASNGLVITSGLALGIDGAAHGGALAAEGLTVAVVGTGLDRVYPPGHLDLARQIVGQGALVSEFPISTPARPENFPRRNALISGLALGVLVVEASLRSGSLITARQALEQGREVFAMPGAVNNPLARGCNKLIRDGAKLVETTADIWQELAPHLQRQVSKLQPQSTSSPPQPLAWEDEALLALIGYEPTAFDDLVATAQMSAEALAAQLLILELEGHVQALSGGFYQRI